MDTLTKEQFLALAGQGRMVPVYRELSADLETPVSVYLKLRGQGASFLLESVEQAEQLGRYSFLGFNPQRQIVAKNRTVTVLDNGHDETRTIVEGEDPLHVVATELGRYQPVASLEGIAQDLPRFFGGAVGYLGYDLVRFFERLPQTAGDALSLPDLHMLGWLRTPSSSLITSATGSWSLPTRMCRRGATSTPPTRRPSLAWTPFRPTCGHRCPPCRFLRDVPVVS